MTNAEWERIKAKKRKWLFYKNGKAKKKYCYCLSREKLAEMKRLYGYQVIQCAGLQCPYYGIECGRSNLKKRGLL